MELTPKQQALERIKAADNILILTHDRPDGDALGSLLALTHALKKLNKQVTPMVNELPPPFFAFLPEIENLTTIPPLKGDFLISVDTHNTGDIKLVYKKDDSAKRLMIMMTPTHGRIVSDSIRFEPSSYNIDLIIVLDCGNLDRIGEVYNQHTSLFYETPVINIDHHVDNQLFGAVNWVDVTATSTAEILVSFLEALSRDPQLIDATVATQLLTGIITDTGSFKHPNTTPKSLTVAAQLVAAGAKQQEIVHYLYKVKPIETLKVWGIALSNIKHNDELKVIWTALSRQDLESVGAVESEAKGVLDELLSTAEGYSFVFFMRETDDGIRVSFRSIDKSISVAEIARSLGGGGHETAAAVTIEGALYQVEERVLEAIRVFWSRRRGDDQRLESESE